MLALSAAAGAVPLNIRVVDASGKPVKGAVVTFRPSASARPMPSGRSYVVSQKDLKFHPFILVVPVGSQVSFPNRDPMKHHVYSFSAAKRFELKLFAKDQSRSVRFDKPGIVALGCNIHDAMSAFIVVADSAWTTQTDARGMVQFRDAPAASGSVSVWHPYLRAKGNLIAQPVRAGQRSASVAVRLRPPPVHAMSDY
jgi:plastocyanin